MVKGKFESFSLFVIFFKNLQNMPDYLRCCKYEKLQWKRLSLAECKKLLNTFITNCEKKWILKVTQNNHLFSRCSSDVSV